MRHVEAHGRILTTSSSAAAWYRRAQEATDRRAAVLALQEALNCDPGFAMAAADVEFLTSAAVPPAGTPSQSWERHHIEIVRTVGSGSAARGRVLLIEHLTAVGCDPIASAIAAPCACRSPCHPLTWMES